jgi:hypothetical protein
MENSNRIQINGVWYVAETATPQAEVKTVDWLISKLQKLSESGFGNAEVTIDLDWGNDYDTVNDVHIMDARRVHIS